MWSFPILRRDFLYTWLWAPRTRMLRIIISVAVIVTHVVAFVLFEPRLGPIAGTFVSLPVIVIALFFGPLAGLIAGVLALPVSTFLYHVVVGTGWEAFLFTPRSIGILILIPIGILVGWLRSLLHYLYTAENVYQNIFEATPDALFLVDERGHIVRANVAAEGLTGYELEDLIGRVVEDLIPEDRRGLHRQQRERYQAHPVRRPMGAGLDLYIRRKDGSLVPVDVGLAPIDLPRGRFTIVGVRDLSLQKETEARIRHAEERYRRLFESAPIMYAVTYDANGEPIITECNVAFHSTLGYDREELIGKPLATVYAPSSRKFLKAPHYRRVMHEGIFAAERQLLTRDGQIVDTLLFAVPEVDETGRVLGTLAMYVDISELKRLEQRLRRREEELSTRNRILSLMLESKDLDAILHQILREVIPFARAELGGIYLLEEDMYVLRAWENLPENIRRVFATVPRDGPYKWVRETTLTRERLEEEGEFPEVVKQAGIQARLSVPLRLPSADSNDADDPMGVLILAARDYDAFDEENVRALCNMADQIALAISHVRTFRSAQERLSRLETLRDIDRAIIRHLDVQEIVHIVLERIPSSLGAEAAALSLIDEETGEPDVFAIRLPNGVLVDEDVFQIAGVLPWFARHPEPVIIYDLESDPRTQPFREIIQRYNLASYLGVPLIVGEKLIGVLHIVSTSHRPFASEDVAFFRTLAGQVAIAIANARAVADLRTRAHAVETVLRAEFARDESSEALEYRLLSTWKEALNIPQAEFFRFDPLTGRLDLTQLVGRSREDLGTLSFTLGDERGLVGWVAHTRKPVYVPDCRTDPRWIPLTSTIRSAYFVPLEWHGRLFGVVTLLSDTPRGFSHAQRDLINLFAMHGAAMLEAHRLLSEAHDHVERLKILADVASRLEQTIAEEEVFAVAGQALYDLCRAERQAILAYDDGELRCRWASDVPAEALRRLTAAVKELADKGVLNGNAPLFVGDVRTLPSDSLPRSVGERARCNAFVVWPFSHEGVVLGYFICCWREPHQWAPYEEEVLRAFSHLLAAALHAAHLYTELQRTNEALQKALSDRDDMLRNVTHELRTPLTMVRGYAELITMGMVAEEKEVQESAEIILRNAMHLQHLLDQLLLFQRLRFQQEELPLTRINVATWLKEVVAGWHRPLEESGHELVLEVEEPLPHVMGHPDYLQRVLNNLLDNACKFSPEGGTITVRAWREGDEVFVAVSDQGVGIPPDQLDKIFERFYQVDASTTRKFGGMGIGLSLCKEIVELHGGRIWAESEGLGKGTTVTFALPAAR